MNDILEVRRVRSPFPRPQALVFAGGAAWVSSIETKRVYELDPASWSVRRDWAAPGTPWGLTSVGAELRAVCGEGEDDDRHIRRLVPATGFDAAFDVPCPDLEGSHLGWDGKTLHLNQWHRQRVLSLSPEGKILRAWPVPHQICGQVIVDGVVWLVSTDNEDSNDYWLTRLDRADGATVDVARIPLKARGLAFDGKNFWTNNRDQHEVVCFAPPQAGSRR
ncbi:MAG: hypothetical protein IT452_03365 [Planctomycetia bacterium]|nr:hypothetical protein [Planctomycetia bacterium]